MITRADVDEARARIEGRVRRTPLIAVDPGAFGGQTWMKLEFLQHTGSFKARGAFNRILEAQANGDLDPAVGTVAASGGNAGLAHAYAGAQLGVPVTVFVPTITSPVKLAKLQALGANVIQAGHEYAGAYEAARIHAEGTGALFCHAYDQAPIAAGAGTLGLEILEDLDGQVDTVVIAVGGGGLLAGVAAAVEGTARVVGVEPTGAPTLAEALRVGSPVDVPVSGVAADSLGARRIGDIALDVALRTGARSLLVSDDDLIHARRLLWDHRRIAVEHGAAAALAALTSGGYVPEPGERVVVVLCGANTDPSDLVG
ncbi:threonine/serine dehydratase [Nocardioides marmorisolisilvae]|uniref:Threonine/serine dehydratase n=1 Tax=Nocardioides marmorisolisilvae TaxID=1542737 RepID=A0A3N0DTC6_9ACTN|nr:threonine/serine dehydratase [Nocardioides marmorisolisilvae]RNL78894.1 threonine/serine dehydratase [Nocardioides marmorisolisilvae]